MDSGDTNVKKTFDIGQVGIINKLHNMQWLKCNSQLSGHTKTLVSEKGITNSNLLKSDTNEGTKGSTVLFQNTFASNSPELDSCGAIPKIYIDESDNIVTKSIQSTLTIVELPQTDMETVWNKDVNVAGTLFPNSQSLVLERLDDKEIMTMALAESIVTAQIEQLRLDDEKKSKLDDLQDESDDEWGIIRPNLPDSPKPDNDVGNQVSSKQCHDNNNNNAKSKAQSASDVKKGVQKPATKISAKKTNEQKTKRLSGSTLKVSCTTPKQGSKEKDNSVNLSKDDDPNTTSATNLKNSPVGSSPKSVDKYGKVEGYNSRSTFTAKGARVKEQQCLKQQFSTFNDSNKNKSSPTEGPGEKGKSFVATTKLKSSRTDSDNKPHDPDDTRKCHKTQVTRTQSYNVQYTRSKSVIKPQLKYSRTTTKPEQETNSKLTSSISSEDGLTKSYEHEQTVTEKQVSDVQQNQGVPGKTLKSSDASECTGTERGSMRPTGFTSYKSTLPNSFSAKTNIERNAKDDQGYTPKFKRDSNVFRRSSDYTEPKYLNARTKPDEHKKSFDNNTAKDYRISRPLPADIKSDTQSESPRTTINPTKTIAGAIKTNKTDTSSTINNIQPAKSLNSCSNSTKAPTTSIIAPNQARKEPQTTTQASYNGTEVQSTVKTEREEHSNNSSNNKTNASISETKSVKFADNVQEINASGHSTMSYSNRSVQPTKSSTNLFYSDLQNASHASNMQHSGNHQNMQSKHYFDNAAQYNNALSANIQQSDRDLQLADGLQQKTEPPHVFSQNVVPQNPHNPPIAAGNGLQYQNMYVNQYTGMQSLPRKTADTTNVPQNSSYSMENQNMLQAEASNILMQNNQTPVLPPPGFHNHPMATQHNQWNVPLSDMLYFGNMMNAAATSTHPLNMQMQPNSRHMCGTDFNNIQQTGYLQHPFFYMPPFCMQGWNPLLQYPTPLFPNTQYLNCGTYPNQVIPSNNPPDSVNCPATTSAQNNPYKQQYQVQQFENNPGNYPAPMKVDNYMGGNMQGCKPNYARMKGADGQMRANQYRPPVPNEYQNYSPDAQTMSPFSYPPMPDSTPRNNVQTTNVQMQANQKYHSRYVYTASCERMLETASQNCQDSHRKDDASKTDSEFVPPMISPKECMYYDVDYSRKTDNIPNSNARPDIKPMPYNMHSGSSQHSVPQFYNNSAYRAPPKDYTPRMPHGRMDRRMTEQ